VQGITEFLPISSTGHLTLVGKFMGLIQDAHPEEWTAFMAVIQMGTLVSIIVYFWNDLFSITKDFVQDNLLKPRKYNQQSSNSKMGWLIIIGTIPVVVIGLAFKDIIEGALTKNLYVIASSLIGLATILAIAEKTAKFNKTMADVGIKEAIIVGLAQSVALIPGSSRSGTTITGGLFAGLNRETAARFSFLLSVPAILASGLLQFSESFHLLTPDKALTLTIATIVSGVSGYLAIDLLLKFLRKYSTFVFIYYRIALGVIILVLLFMGIIQP